MKEYIITIEDDIDVKLQYLAENNKVSTPTPISINGTTVQEILQFIINDKIAHMVLVADSIREKEYIEAIKTDSTLLATVEAKCDEIKTEKEAAIAAAIEEANKPPIEEKPLAEGGEVAVKP